MRRARVATCVGMRGGTNETRIAAPPRWLASGLLSLLLGAGCRSEPADELAWQVSFGCEADRAHSDQLRLKVLEGGCQGRPLYEASLAQGQRAAPDRELPPGRYGFEATALGDGSAFASGCVEGALPSVEPLQIVLVSEACAASANDGGSSLDADTPDSCREQRCVSGLCLPLPFTGPRECDGLACTRGDRCVAGECQAGAGDDAACPDDGNPCTLERCLPGVGCGRANAAAIACDDGFPCTEQDRCQEGVCLGSDNCPPGLVCSAAARACVRCGGPEDCDDRDPCSDDACLDGVCQYLPNRAPCDDGMACTRDDRCEQGRCAGASTCPAGAPCAGSECQCGPGQTPCAGTCAELASAREHCGACGRACGDGQRCENGACAPEDAPACTPYRYRAHDYLVCSEPRAWTAARERCRAWGFGLAILDDAAENAFLSAHLADAQSWIAANDRGDASNCARGDPEDMWYWASATEPSEHATPLCEVDAGQGGCRAVAGAYLNWGRGQPNNGNCRCSARTCDEGEDCALLLPDGTWSDFACGDAFGYICEAP